MLDGLRELEREGAIKLDMHTHIVYAPDWLAEEPASALHTLINNAPFYISAHISTRFVKIILDGVPIPPYYTHAGLLPDSTPDSTPDTTPDTSKLFLSNIADVIAKYDARGLTLKIHCTGHGSTRLTHDTIEAARKRNPHGPRHEIAHCHVHDDDYKRFRPLNVTARMSPAFFFTHPVTAASGGLMDWNFLKMLAADARVTIGSDWSVGESPGILPCLGEIVDGVDRGDRAVGAARICTMLTLAGAEAVGRKSEFGSIEVGKRANFIAVNNDLSLGEFDGARALTTWSEGEIVYEAGK